MSGSYPNLLASGVAVDDTFAPFQLWAGEADIVTSQGTAGATVRQFAVVGRVTTGGKLIECVTTATDGSQVPVGIAMQAAVNNGPIVFLVGGVVNAAAILWPASATTLALQKALFDRTNIVVSALL